MTMCFDGCFRVAQNSHVYASLFSFQELLLLLLFTLMNNFSQLSFELISVQFLLHAGLDGESGGKRGGAGMYILGMKRREKGKRNQNHEKLIIDVGPECSLIQYAL